MSDDRDEKMESMLRSRRMDRASADLAERIILKARAIPQRRDASLWQLVRDLCAEFHLPRPAYVLAGALALGMVVGFNAPWNGIGAQNGIASDPQVFLATDEEIL